LSMDQALDRLPRVASPRDPAEELARCPMGCRGNDLCRRCREGVKLEALSWLRDLSDRVFGDRDDPGTEVILVRSQGWLSPGSKRFG
jgi:hypothetical protein